MKRILSIAIIAIFACFPLFSQPSAALVNLLERANLIAEREQDPLIQTIALFQAELGTFNAVEQAIIHSMIGESLWAYLQQNRFAIFERTTLANPDMTDIRTWDTRLLLQQTIHHYTASLEPREALQNLRVRDFSAILTLGDDESEIQRPTMFDLLAHRAINTLSQHDIRLTQPQEGELLNEKIRELFSCLTVFHAQENNPDIIIPLELQRLAWERANVISEYADRFYRDALEYLSLRFPESEARGEIHWALAQFHYELGNRHNSLVSDDFRLDRFTALGYAQKIQTDFPQSPFANPARAMAERIQQPTISLQMQEIILPNQPNLFLLEGRNLDTIYLTWVRQFPSQLRSGLFLQNRQEFIRSLLIVRSPEALQTLKQHIDVSLFQRQIIIPNPGDFQTHRIELPIPFEPSVGYYILFASTSPDISQENIVLASQVFGVSELSVVTNTSDGKLEGIVLNRRTGEPMRGVNVRVFSQDFNWRTQETTTTELAMLTSARNGRFQFSGDVNNRPVQIELRHRLDVLKPLQNSHWWVQNQRPERSHRQLFFFTDRAIYRPGQIVYFKGILVERSGDQSRILTNETTTVTLRDANHREINSIEVTTNEYGSFSGRFVLPMRGLLGQFSLQNPHGMTFFSVEE